MSVRHGIAMGMADVHDPCGASAPFLVTPSASGDESAMATIIHVPIRTAGGLNNREAWQARARRVRSEREAVAWLLKPATKPSLPCSVLLTRLAPSNGLDDDGLAGSLKAVRDEVASWLGVDDRDRATVRYRYAQRRGPWGVTIEFGPPADGDRSTLEVIG